MPASETAVLADYSTALRSAPLSDQTRRTYASKVRQYLAWLVDADLDEDPLASAAGRDWAVRDYRTHLQTVLKRSPATVNNALAAVDDFYIRRGLGPASAARVEISAAAPCALDHRAQLRYLRAVQARGLSVAPSQSARSASQPFSAARSSGWIGTCRRRSPLPRIRRTPLRAERATSSMSSPTISLIRAPA